MAGIPAKCLDCGTILAYDGSRWVYVCPACEAGKGGRTEAMQAEEKKKAA
jgi:predicted RNA-binding Zn-ribbon protein involved in translation (DUF1610 family)